MGIFGMPGMMLFLLFQFIIRRIVEFGTNEGHFLEFFIVVADNPVYVGHEYTCRVLVAHRIEVASYVITVLEIGVIEWGVLEEVDDIYVAEHTCQPTHHLVELVIGVVALVGLRRVTTNIFALGCMLCSRCMMPAI